MLSEFYIIKMNEKLVCYNTVKHGYNEVPGTDDFASL